MTMKLHISDVAEGIIFKIHETFKKILSLFSFQMLKISEKSYSLLCCCGK